MQNFNLTICSHAFGNFSRCLIEQYMGFRSPFFIESPESSLEAGFIWNYISGAIGNKFPKTENRRYKWVGSTTYQLLQCNYNMRGNQYRIHGILGHGSVTAFTFHGY